MKEQKYFVSAKALFLDNKKSILIAKSNPEELEPGTPVHWDLPGGRLDIGDTLKSALYREVKEEIDIDQFTIEELFDASLSNMISAHDKGDVIQLVLFTYTCKFSEPQPKITLSSEHTEYKWAPINEAKDLLSYKFSQEFISKLDRLQ